MQPKIFIKYGEYEHLKQIVDGKLRFAPSQNYVLMEKEQHNKGQGDLLEGKMKIKIERAKMYHPETNELLATIPKSEFLVSIQDVNNMPVFCISGYDEKDIKEKDGKNFLKISPDKIDCIKTDFEKATHALIIFDASGFINDVCQMENHAVANDYIHYYDYDINTLQMFAYLATGSEEYEKNKELVTTYDNRFRHLLCKDISFSQQQEYRFIILDELIEKPVFYTFNFSSKYIIVPIDDLYNSIEII